VYYYDHQDKGSRSAALVLGTCLIVKTGIYYHIANRN
jgi:hypothetical protein